MKCIWGKILLIWENELFKGKKDTLPGWTLNFCGERQNFTSAWGTEEHRGKRGESSKMCGETKCPKETFHRKQMRVNRLR